VLARRTPGLQRFPGARWRHCPQIISAC
jgi:hypothetical protein